MQRTACARRSSCQNAFGRGFNSPHLHHTNITQNPISISAASLLRYGLCNYKQSRELNCSLLSCFYISDESHCGGGSPLSMFLRISSKVTGVTYAFIILQYIKQRSPSASSSLSFLQLSKSERTFCANGQLTRRLSYLIVAFLSISVETNA